MFAHTARADDSDYDIDKNHFRVKHGGSIELPCVGDTYFVRDRTVYVACGVDGVVIVTVDALEPIIQRWIAVPGRADGFFEAEGEVWVRLQSVSALKLTSNTPVTAPTPTPTPSRRVTFKPLRTKPPPDTTFSAAEDPYREAPKGKKPITPFVFPDWVFPRRHSDLFAASAQLTAMVPAGEGGFSLLAYADATYRASIPLAIHAKCDPFAFVWADGGNVMAVSTLLVASVDTQNFELGFGSGGATVNEIRHASKGGLLLGQYLRLGPSDGLHVLVETQVFMPRIERSRSWEFAGLQFSFAIPVSSAFALVGHGGGSRAGYGKGELGLRYRAHGDGGRGSLYFSLLAGGAGLYFAPGGLTYAGPAFGLGFEVRP